ncbi:MAG TPA: hypothetical protein VIE43_06465 [Thermoanaerobaculia bacterium]|jgi:hypothetical protein|nr:hypothetical protein [Thermoanaerobaculia bacterium]
METPTHPREIRLRAVIVHRGEWWVGGCLEHAIGSQARTREALIADLERMVRFHLQRAEDKGLAEPFAAIPQSPKVFRELYESGAGERLAVVIHPSPSATATVELLAA